MSNSADLLRMLEPAVRPGGVPGPAQRRTEPLPIEQRSFESLLQDVQSKAGEADGSAAMDAADPAEAGGNDVWSAESDGIAGGIGKRGINPLSPLSHLDAISNASLRDLIARTAAAGDAARPDQEASTIR